MALNTIFSAVAGSVTNTFPSSVQLPFEFRRGSLFLYFRAHNNDSKPLSLKLDTGFGITTVHHELVETLHLNRIGTLTVVGIAGELQAVTYKGAHFDFGGVTFSPPIVTVISSDSLRNQRGRDVILGADFFQRFVVEVDSAQYKLTLHDPNQFDYNGKGESLPLEFRKDTPIVEATINLTNHQSVTAKFEIDTGCDGELCLGHDFVQTNSLSRYKKSSRVRSRTGVGGSVGTQSAILPQFQLGKLTLDRLPANLFTDGSPVDDGLAGHIGMKTLRRFKVIFDYSRKRMILETSP